MSNETQALTVVPRQALSHLVFNSNDPLHTLEALGTIAAKSGAMGLDSTQAGAAVIITCIETGITLTEYNRTYDTILGKPRKKAARALVEFVESGGKWSWVMYGDEPQPNPDDQRAVLELERGDKKVKYTYSLADAKAEGLVKPGSRYTKRPGNMLRARCISNAIGIIAPEIYVGDDDEGRQLPELQLAPAPTVTAAPAPAVEPKPAKVVELKPVSQDEKEEAKMGLAPLPKQEVPAVSAPAAVATSTPSPAPSAEAKPFSAGPKYDSANKTLPKELVDECEKAIADNPADLERAYKWMVKEGWLAADQDISFLSEARAKRIIKQRDSFRRAVKEAAL